MPWLLEGHHYHISSILQKQLQHSETAASADLQNAAVFPDEHILFEHASPEMAIRSSPPVQQPPARKRKRKQLFDECVVLKNSFMERVLDNPSDIPRKRKNIPSSAFGGEIFTRGSHYMHCCRHVQ